MVIFKEVRCGAISKMITLLRHLQQIIVFKLYPTLKTLLAHVRNVSSAYGGHAYLAGKFLSLFVDCTVGYICIFLSALLCTALLLKNMLQCVQMVGMSWRALWFCFNFVFLDACFPLRRLLDP